MDKKKKLNKGAILNRDLKLKNEHLLEESCNQHGEINIRQNKRRKRLESLCKGVLVVSVAAISGAITASYIIEKKYNNMVDNRNNSSVIYSNKQQIPKDDKIKELVPKNDINKVVEGLSGIIVGVSSNPESFLQNDITSNMGSGIIIDKDGYIVTNSFLLENTEIVYVKLSSYGSKPIEAKIIGKDKASDLAVIKVDLENLPYARFGDSEKVRVGDLAIAVGNPLGEDMADTVTMGIVSVINKKIDFLDPNTGEKRLYKIVKTDASINSYNTGGALCNSIGEIVGINSLKLTGKYASEGIGISIPSNEVKNIVESLTNYGRVKKPHLGFIGQTIVRNNSSNTQGIEGVYVREVTQGETLFNAGVGPTDIIVGLDNKEIKRMEDIQIIVDEHKIGDTINCKIWREGSVLELSIILTEKQ
ncbi:S1C family serine protease [Clostridium algidicarnis]|uniref:Serine protease Do n=2 Tax=Clostridium algidicarnis TaxID=37659 RepID=A0A2S6FZ06_9CLOT|nr:trypsin-like peptidase domain-containing protein [Clostridium algidicarnis]MBB6630119.1 trypsin-like peptidase domain-containing protein [Clostridium algidicarnis]MBB6696877.1 trypsin-like peptidase domain-containing protein [Clostridium algidicarnis]MBU3193226.1 S1C family serine protease [Clostridium algidicarnis]MBU3204582.1 S1C family serine protease [Clostridium algidicarnis]MBU3206536.1 S1C family serine protease [Clostridium algidicarnis]